MTYLIDTDPSFQLPLNLVLLKNVAVVGIHWGAYSGNPSFPKPF